MSPKNLFYHVFWAASILDPMFLAYYQSLRLKSNDKVYLKQWKSEPARWKFYRIFATVVIWGVNQFPKYFKKRCGGMVIIFKQFYKTYTFSRRSNRILIQRCSWILKPLKTVKMAKLPIISIIDTSPVAFNGCKARNMRRKKKRKKRAIPKSELFKYK